MRYGEEPREIITTVGIFQMFVQRVWRSSQYPYRTLLIFSSSLYSSLYVSFST